MVSIVAPASFFCFVFFPSLPKVTFEANSPFFLGNEGTKMVTVERTLRALAGLIISDSWHVCVFLCQSVLIFVSLAGSIVSEVPESVGAADGAAAVSHRYLSKPWGLHLHLHLHLSDILFKESCTNLRLACVALQTTHKRRYSLSSSVRIKPRL